MDIVMGRTIKQKEEHTIFQECLHPFCFVLKIGNLWTETNFSISEKHRERWQKKFLEWRDKYYFELLLENVENKKQIKQDTIDNTEGKTKRIADKKPRTNVLSYPKDYLWEKSIFKYWN